MKDHYQTLGVSPTASPDEIKKAYRKLANQHHPDKGGDQAKFKDVSVAYETLSNDQKRQEYDMMRQGGGPQVRFTSGGFQDFADIFGGFDPFGRQSNPFFGEGFGRRMARNRDLNIQCQISLLDSFLGKQLEANYRLPSGRNQTVVINVPAGVSNGETIRYQGLGDDSIPQAPRGNLNVTIVVIPDQNYRREGDDLYTSIKINPIEAMIGCVKKVKLITGQEVEIDIRGGVDSNGREYSSAGQGFINPHTGNKGNFITEIKIESPHITEPHLIDVLKKINNEISKRS